MFFPSDYLITELSLEIPKLKPILRSVGNIALDEMLNSPDNKVEDFLNLKLDINRKTLLMVSTWGDDSLLSTQGDNFLERALELSSIYNVILSLHPNCYNKKSTDGKRWPHLLEQCKKTKNMYVVPPAGNIFHLMKYIDLYVADKTSLSLYFSILEKPMVLINNPGMAFNKVSPTHLIREITPLLDDVNEFTSDFIENVISNFNQAEYSELSQRICSYKGQSLTRHKIEIYELLGLSYKPE